MNALPSRVVVLDVETADSTHSQICAIALVQLDGDAVVGEWSSLVCPPAPPAARNVEIHGLTWDKLRGQPPLARVWPIVLGLLEGAEALVAHNASFDRGALERACLASSLQALPLPWLCTMVLARQAWPSLPNHKLPTLASKLGVELQHHDALSDAQAAAKVYLEARKALASGAPLARTSPVVAEERIGSDGPHTWTWRKDRDRAELAINGKLLLRCTDLPGGARSLVVFNAEGEAVVSVSASGPALARYAELLLETLRAAVLVTRQSHRVSLTKAAWDKIVEGRPGAERRAA